MNPAHALGWQMNARLRYGYQHEAPDESAPPGVPADRMWTLAPGRILVRRWDRDVARHNECVADDLWASTSDYQHTTTLEELACPACGESLTVAGRWGEAAQLHCGCGFAENVEADWGRHLLQRLILADADPGYEARRLLPEISAEHAAQLRLTSWGHTGPDDRDADLVAAIDSGAQDLAATLLGVLEPELPRPYPGRPLTLLLLEAALTLNTPAVRDSADGPRLADAVRGLVVSVQEAADRFASTRRSIIEQLNLWQRPGGPAQWQQAWVRLRQMIGPQTGECRVRHGVFTDGLGGLLVGLYVVSRTEGIAPAEVSVEQLRVLAGLATDGKTPPDQPAEVSEDLPAQWADRLRSLGHDLDDGSDPVTEMWQRLQTVYTPPDGVYTGLDRHGHALVYSLPRLLAASGSHHDLRWRPTV